MLDGGSLILLDVMKVVLHYMFYPITTAHHFLDSDIVCVLFCYQYRFLGCCIFSF
jgi:hypothetical protein